MTQDTFDNPEWTETAFDNLEEETSLPGKEDIDTWTIHFDGSYTKGQGGTGVILTSPTGERLKYVVQMCRGTVPGTVGFSRRKVSARG